VTLGGAPAVLYHSRLAIVDLSHAGDQPMSNEDGRLSMVFNGEIYNHEELRSECISRGHTFRSNMDGEVILHLWEDEGPACLARLNGIFAVAIADTQSGELFLARDPLGVKPLVYSVGNDGSLTFASEISALAQLGAALPGPDVTALGCFLTFMWVPDPLTLMRGASALQPGRYLRWSVHEPLQTRSYRVIVPRPEMVRGRAFADALVELRAVLGSACERQLLGDVPISVMASGGVDSSLVWASAGKGVDRAYTIRWPEGSKEGSGEDARAVERLHEALGTPVTFLDGAGAEHGYLPSSGDLFGDPAYELTRLIARATRADGRKVLLSGQGGDELFGAPLLGRLTTGAAGRSLPRLLEHVPGGLNVEFAARFARASSHRDPFRRYMELCSYSTADERARVLGCSAAEVSDEVVLARHREYWDALPEGLSFLRKAMALDLGVYLPGLGLGYVDRAGMEFGVEIRVPLLDLDLVEWSFTLADEHLVRRGSGKLLPKALAREVIPPEVVDRPKRGFGAPSDTLATRGREEGTKGHRQGKYFALAADVATRWIDAVPTTFGDGE
jgi:asparagine synthase (glutamine-hydrolysing)